MKTGIHPRYELTTVTCACGNVFETRSTRKNVRVDVCSVCHPFYTGEQRIIDTAGQVERFTNRVARAAGETKVSKRQQRINEKSTQLAEERRRIEEAQAAARAAQRDRAKAVAEARAAAEAAAAEAAGAEEAFADQPAPAEATAE